MGIISIFPKPPSGLHKFYSDVSKFSNSLGLCVSDKVLPGAAQISACSSLWLIVKTQALCYLATIQILEIIYQHTAIPINIKKNLAK